MNMPQAPTIRPPVMINPQYDVMGEKAGRLLTGLTKSIAQMPQDLKAYEELQKQTQNLEDYKEKLIADALGVMGSDWSEKDRNAFVAKVRSSKNVDELVNKGTALYVNRAYQKRNKLPVSPLWGQEKYMELMAPLKEKATTAAQIKGAEGARGYGGRLEAGVTATGGAAPTKAFGDIESARFKETQAQSKLALQQGKLALQDKMDDIKRAYYSARIKLNNARSKGLGEKGAGKTATILDDFMRIRRAYQNILADPETSIMLQQTDPGRLQEIQADIEDLNYIIRDLKPDLPERGKEAPTDSLYPGFGAGDTIQTPYPYIGYPAKPGVRAAPAPTKKQPAKGSRFTILN